MAITNTQFTAWLNDPAALRCMLLEVTIGQNGSGSPLSRYLSNKTFVSSSTDSPANNPYMARIKGGFQFSRSINVSGDVSLSFGDISIDNTDGALDSWLNDYWVNRPFTILIGDPTWNRSDFRTVFVGRTLGIDCKDRTTLNIQVSDNTQRLNTAVSQTLLGGTSSLANNLVPLTFGEAHNVSPLISNGSTNEYQVHTGAIERIIEVRDNGVPVTFSSTPGTGKFTLAAAPYGTITASVQGALLPTSFYASSDILSGQTSVNVGVNTSSSGTPYAAIAACLQVTMSAVSGQHYIFMPQVTVTASQVNTISIFVKLNTLQNRYVSLDSVSTISGARHTVTLDAVTGTTTLTTNSIYASNAGSTSSFGAVAIGNGWYRLWLSGYPDNTSTNLQSTFRFTDVSGNTTFTGDGTTVNAYICGYQFEVGGYPTSFVSGSALNVPVFRNTVVENIKNLVTNYGDVSKQFALTEIDIPTFVQYECLYRQPIGVFLTDKTNVYDLCTQLASSIGARLCMDENNLLTLVRLDLSQASPGTIITSTNMVEKSLSVSSLPPVVAAVNLGFCKNWTVQSSVAGGLDGTSAQMFNQEWLNAIQIDSTAAANYNLTTAVTQTDTLLVVGADAETEALRRLDLFNFQRKILKYTGFYGLLFESLGGYQSLQSTRFGANTSVGQIISISTDFASSHIEFEIII